MTMINVELLKELEAIVKMKVEEELKNRGFIPTDDKEGDDWMNQKEAAAYAGVCVNTFKNYETYGLKVFRNNKKILVSKAEVDRYLRKHSR